MRHHVHLHSHVDCIHTMMEVCGWVWVGGWVVGGEWVGEWLVVGGWWWVVGGGLEAMNWCGRLNKTLDLILCLFVQYLNGILLKGLLIWDSLRQQIATSIL